jgi:ankyrin repeat protein
MQSFVIKVLYNEEFLKHTRSMKTQIMVLAAILTAACNLGPPLSPLISATREGDVAKMAELIKAGADVNERGGVNDWTPLMHAVHKDQAAAIRVLIAAGADLKLTAGARGRDTALSLAEVQDRKEIAAILREALREEAAKTAQ